MKRVVIDTDPGIDDTFAILTAINAPKLRIEGITTVEGNGPIDVVTNNVFRILSLADHPDIKVYQGGRLPGKDFTDVHEIHGRDGWGDIFSAVDWKKQPESESAVDFLIRIVTENPNEITIAALGPLVNIAAAIRKDPEAMKKAEGLVIMGGAIEGGNVTACSEANFHNAPEAARVVMNSGIENITMVGLDVTRKFLISSRTRELFLRMDGKMAKTLYDISQKYVDFHWRSGRQRGFTPHDVMVLLYIIRPGLFTTRKSRVEVVTEGVERGRSMVNLESNTPNAEVCIDSEIQEAIRLMLTLLFPGHVDDIDNVLN